MNNITNAQAYAKFINKTVDTIAQISISTQPEKHFIKHIKAFIKSYQTSEKEFINWIFDGKYHQSNVEDGEKYRQPTTAECLNWYYTLLAIIHDGQKQGNNLYRRIYFNLQEPETAFENTAKTLWVRYAKNPENFPDNLQTTYQLLIEDALRGVNEDLLTASGGKAEETQTEPDLEHISVQEKMLFNMAMAVKNANDALINEPFRRNIRRLTTEPQEQNSGNAGADNLIDASQNSEYSKPMSKSVMMKALGIDSLTKFNGFAKRHGIKKITRKTWQLRLNDLSSREREKLEKA